MAANLEIVIKGIDHASGVLRGVDKEASGLSKTLGTGVKVAGAAAAGGILAAAFAAPKFISAAADLTEAINKANVVFGDSSKRVEGFAATSAKSFGIAKGEAFAYAGTLGTILKGSGLAQDAAADMSIDLVKLAADMASFNNIPIDQALEKIRAGLVGESEPLRTVGVLLSETAVKEKAYALGLAATGAVLTDQQKVQARYALILEQTKDTQGDFARTSESLTNQQRILGAEWKNIQAILGGALLPIVTRLAQTLTKFLTENEEEIKRAADAFSAWAESDALPFLERAFTQLAQLIKGVMDTGIIQWIADHKIALIGLAVALGVVVLAFGGPIPIIIALIAAGTILLAHWDQIRNKIEEVVDWMREHKEATTAIAIAIGVLLGPFGILIGTIALAITHWEKIAWAVNNLVIPAFNGVMVVINGVVIPALGFYVSYINTVVIPAISGLVGFIQNVLIPTISSIVGVALPIGDVLSRPFREARDWVKVLVDWIDRLIDRISRIHIPDLTPNINLPNIPGFQHGGTIMRRGLQLVGERGPELTALPVGARVFSNTQSQQMLSGATGGGGNTFIYQPTYSTASPAEAERFMEWVETALQRRARHG